MNAPQATSPATVTLDAAGATDTGRKRERNEDAYFIATLQRSMVVHDASPVAARGWLAGHAAGTMLIVADGMGGLGGGELASRVAV
jgi:PPM family protein phosphatase